MIPLLLLFLLIIILIRLRVPIGFALLAGALFLGIWNFGVGRDFWYLLYRSFINLKSWRLVVTVAVILMFANLYEATGFVGSMVSSLKTFLSSKWVARAAPSIIGLLPMPGGAMVSAPIVREIAKKSDLKPETLTAANYWWRHVWEATWPLYPSIILAAAVLGISVWDVAIINFPISLTCIAAGLFIGGVGDNERSKGRKDPVKLLKSLWPILFIVLLGLILNVDLIFSVVFIIAILTWRYQIKGPVLKAAFRKAFSLNIIVLIFGVMTLMYAMEQTGTASLFYGELLEMSVPASLVVFAVPFVVGLLTGVTAAYIGVGFPIVLPLIGTEMLSFRAGTLLAFAGGFMGVMASPVHLCLVLTKDYFRASLAGTILRILPLIAVTSFISWALASLFYG
jgi:integral membrane protein (TIGR00529 family)